MATCYFSRRGHNPIFSSPTIPDSRFLRLLSYLRGAVADAAAWDGAELLAWHRAAEAEAAREARAKVCIVCLEIHLT